MSNQKSHDTPLFGFLKNKNGTLLGLIYVPEGTICGDFCDECIRCEPDCLPGRQHQLVVLPEQWPAYRVNRPTALLFQEALLQEVIR